YLSGLSAPAIGFRFRLPVAFFPSLALFVVLAGEALQIGEQRIGEAVLLAFLGDAVAGPWRRFDVRQRGCCCRCGALGLVPGGLLLFALAALFLALALGFELG